VEVRGLDIDAESEPTAERLATVAARGGQGAGSRDSLIWVALAGFRREIASGKTVLCSERAWIVQAFRDATRTLPSADELRRNGVSVDDDSRGQGGGDGVRIQ